MSYDEDFFTKQVYGYFPKGGDPRCFSPDPETNSPAEYDAWKRDCERWNEGHRDYSVSHGREWLVEGVASVKFAGYGLGVYNYDCEESE